MEQGAGEMNCVLSYNSDCGTVGYWNGQSCWQPWDWDGWCYRYPAAQINYVTNVEDRVSRAFKIVQKLMETGVIKQLTIKEFIKSVTDISELI